MRMEITNLTRAVLYNPMEVSIITSIMENTKYMNAGGQMDKAIISLYNNITF